MLRIILASPQSCANEIQLPCSRFLIAYEGDSYCICIFLDEETVSEMSSDLPKGSQLVNTEHRETQNSRVLVTSHYAMLKCPKGSQLVNTEHREKLTTPES